MTNYANYHSMVCEVLFCFSISANFSFTLLLFYILAFSAYKRNSLFDSDFSVSNSWCNSWKKTLYRPSGVSLYDLHL